MKELIILIELGHCETIVSCNDYICNQKKILWQESINSAVSIIKQEGRETICIGNSAVSNQPIAQKCQIGFRKSPSDMNPDERYCLERFLQGIYYYVLEKYPELSTERHEMWLQLPSYGKMWDKDQEFYRGILSPLGSQVSIKYKRRFNGVGQTVPPYLSLCLGIEGTCAAYHYLENSSLSRLCQPCILPSVRKIRSAVAILGQDDQKTICIGDQAIINAPFSKSYKDSFDNRPSFMDESERMLLCIFLRQVYDNILTNCHKIKNNVPVHLVIPTAFCRSSHDFEGCRLICADAKIPLVNIQPRSLDIFKQVSCWPDSPLDNQSVTKGTIIIEIGEKYIVITQIYNNKEDTCKGNWLSSDLFNCMDISIDVHQLYDNSLSECLLKYLIKHPTDAYMERLVERFEKYGHIPSYYRIKRRLKESFENYIHLRLPAFDCIFDYGFMTSGDEEPIYGFGVFSVNREKMDEILLDYYNCIQQSIYKSVGNSLNQHKTPNVILNGIYPDGICDNLETYFHSKIIQCNGMII